MVLVLAPEVGVPMSHAMFVVVLRVMAVIMVVIMAVIMLRVMAVIMIIVRRRADRRGVRRLVCVCVPVPERGIGKNARSHRAAATAVADGAGRREMRTKAMAAPKPLSMFTTVTPAAQLDSIPSSAASPPSDAP